MQPAILIYPKEMKYKIAEDVASLMPFMHFVAEIDMTAVKILKNRFDGKLDTISLYDLGDYLNDVIYLGAGLYLPSDSVE